MKSWGRAGTTQGGLKDVRGIRGLRCRGSLLCTWCHDCWGMWPWWLSWRCACRLLGNQADIWGFWPGARLWHPDGRGRRGGRGPEDHLPRVSDSFSLDYQAFNLYPLLRLLFLLPVPHIISSSHLTFWRLVFLVITPRFFSLSFPLHPPFGTLASFPPPPLPTPPPLAPLSVFLSPPSLFLSFLFHFSIISSSSAAAIHEK